jgi:hypothetical protein
MTARRVGNPKVASSNLARDMWIYLFGHAMDWEDVFLVGDERG